MKTEVPMKRIRRLLASLLAATLCLSVLPFPLMAAEEEDGGESEAEQTEYYVCFGDQNFAVRPANLMEKREDVYLLSDVTMTGNREFYVTDNKGMRYYGSDNETLTVEESGSYSYDILFSPDRLFDSEDEDSAKTDCHVSYRFHVPDSYSVNIDGTETPLTYNPYHTDYDLYVISCIRLEAGQTVSYGEESHSIRTGGCYRILFTPGERLEGKEYAFDKDGEYGSGEDYTYHLYLEDTLRYFAVFETALNLTADTEISGSPAYLLSRFEENVTTEEYRTGKFFIGERDAVLRYKIYEEGLSGSFRLLDDDNDEDTDVSKLTLTDAGWYQLSFSPLGDRFLTVAAEESVKMGGYYAVGDFNRYGFNGNGGVDISGKYLFCEIEEDDPDYGDDYNADYTQYILFLTVSEGDLEEGNLEFYITDGENKYKNNGEYISLNTPGRYKILFSDEHAYGGGRFYRYTLLDDDSPAREIEIRTVEEYLAFAGECNRSADYSVGLSVWLCADLDFEGVEFVPVNSFSGRFYGSTHSFSNITLTSDQDDCGIFGRVNRTGSVERLNVVNLTLCAEDCTYVGVVARNYGTLKKITVDGSVKGKQTVGGIVGLNGQSEIDGDSSTVDSGDEVQKGKVIDCTGRARVQGEISIGGIAGMNVGEISGCENGGEVLPYAKKSGADLESIGGICGYSAGQICDSVNRASVGSVSVGEYVGGICGLCTGEIYFCTNSGSVIGSRYVGGLVGYFGTFDSSSDAYTGITVEDILATYFPQEDSEGQLPEGTVSALAYGVNGGSVSAGSYAGGIVGYSRVDTMTILHSASVGDIKTAVGDYAGGICGYADGSGIRGCLSGGSVDAHGSYAGGICGIGSQIESCLSSADVSGADYVGGIAGLARTALRYCYTNCLIRGDSDARYMGAVAGAADQYNSSLNSFCGLVQDNYFIASSVGGVGGVDYGKEFDYAACPIECDRLAYEGMLSPYLHETFSHTDWVGGADSSHYPAPYYLTVEADDLPECGESDEVKALFGKHLPEYAELIADTTAITYTLTVWEWNKNLGDLYKDGELQTDNFEKTATLRLPAGGKIENIYPTLAELRDGKYRYESDDANYYVYLDLPQTLTENLVVYAGYREIATSLEAENGKLLVEGEFVKGTTVELLTLGECMTLRFTLDGEEIAVGPVTVKFRLPDPQSNAFISLVDGEAYSPVERKVSGAYLCFDWSDGIYFTLQTPEKTDLPSWAYLLMGGGAALVLCGAAIGIGMGVRKKSKKMKENS
ncbi:MAG: hypothetical protein ACI3XR_10450 [Eubacteriales bacterium]